MRNKQAEKVIRRLRKGNKTFNIMILGDKQNQMYAFSILMLSGQSFIGTTGNCYHGANIKTINLLKEAKIKFGIIP